MTTTSTKANVNEVNKVNNEIKSNKGLLFNQKDDSQSAYGLTVKTICQDPTIDRARLLAILEANNINIAVSKSAIQTGISQTVKIIRMLNNNGFIKGL
jgi:hypothetical protein